jgi:hypothetical protein
MASNGAFDQLTDEDAEQLKGNTTVRRQIARIDHPKKQVGRPCGKTPRQMRTGINGYFRWCEKNDRVPSIKGMMLHMKMMRDAFYNYIDRPEFRDILEQARTVITEWVEVDIYNTPGQAAGKIAYAKNVLDWTDKLNTVNTNETTVRTVLTVEQAQAKIASLAHLIDPRLIEDLTSRSTLRELRQEDETTIDVDTGAVTVEKKPRRV